MADSSDTRDQNNQKLAWENCAAQQVVQSMFDHVVQHDHESLAHRSDRNEIQKFSTALVESEIIFGSPNDEVLESVERKIVQKKVAPNSQKPPFSNLG